MKSKTPGRSTLKVEVTNISQHGFWLLFDDKEVFLPFDEFPWFKNAPVSEILKVKLVSPSHLYWPDLDVDLSVESIENPDRYPLIANAKQAR